jgi:hypothetical protein
MDSVLAIVLCNCAISIGCLTASVCLVRLRRQLVTLTQWCDRATNDCGWLLADAPQTLATTRSQIRQIRQVYRQQSVNVDRIQSIRRSIGIIRSLLR